MRIYAIILHTGRYEDAKQTLLCAHVAQSEAEKDALARQEHIQELVAKWLACEAEYEKWVDENPSPGLDVCKCDLPETRCDACKSWYKVYDIMVNAIRKSHKYDALLDPMPQHAEEGFYLRVQEIDLHGTVFDFLA